MKTKRSFLYLISSLLILMGCSSPKYAVKKATIKEFSNGTIIISEYVNKNEYDEHGDIVKCTTSQADVVPVFAGDMKTGTVKINDLNGKIFSFADLGGLNEKVNVLFTNRSKDEKNSVNGLSGKISLLINEEINVCKVDIGRLIGRRITLTSIDELNDKLTQLIEKNNESSKNAESLKGEIISFLNDEKKSGKYYFKALTEPVPEEFNLKESLFTVVIDENKDGKIDLQDLNWKSLKGESLFNGKTVGTKVYSDNGKNNTEKTTAFIKSGSSEPFYEYEYNLKYIIMLQAIIFVILGCLWALAFTAFYRKTHKTKKNKFIILSFFFLSQIIKVLVVIVISSLLMRVSEITINNDNSPFALNIFGFMLDAFFTFLLYPLAAVLIGLIPEKQE